MSRRRIQFADDDPVLASFDTMTGDELAALRVDYGRMAQMKAAEQTTMQARIAKITGILRTRTRGRWEVTDHAVIRYLERAKGVDISAVRSEIIAAVEGATATKPVKGEAVGLVVGDLVFVVVRERQIVTIHPPEGTPR